MRPSDRDLARAGAILTIDLDAIVANWRTLSGLLATAARCAAVVKADAYGLGMDRVAPALAAAGCETFFVAQIDEGIALRQLLPDVEIGVLAAPIAGVEQEFQESRLLPVLNSMGDLDAWRAFAAKHRQPPAILHVDTGMSRLGLTPRDVETIAAEPSRIAGLRFAYVISHLACSDEPDHPLNRAQLSAFRAMLSQLPFEAPASLANASGIFLGADYHFDLARPGVALYGVNPVPGRPNPMRPVVRLQGRVLQVREIDRRASVGYGAIAAIDPPATLATVSVGYADGYPRSLSGKGRVTIDGFGAPIVGRVSMDLTVVDVTGLPADTVTVGTLVDLIGPGRDIETVATEAGTIAYELLTSLGSRYRRRYIGAHD